MDISQYPKVGGKRFDEWAPWSGRGVPTRDTCDLGNPRQRFLWMFTAAPGQRGAPLIMPIDFYEGQSYHMCALGAGIVSEPGLKWLPPTRMVENWWSAQGDWVGLDAPEPPRTTMADIVAKLPQQDRAELRELITNQLGVEDVADPSTPAGWLRVEDVAKRLGVGVDQVRALLDSFGMPSGDSDLVSRDIAVRITAHLGLDD